MKDKKRRLETFSFYDRTGIEAHLKSMAEKGWMISENVVTVVSGSLKSYFYFVIWTAAAANGLKQGAEALSIVWDGEYICQNLAFRTEDEAVVLVLGNVDTHTDHDDTSGMFI